jgi:hypothetical protein
MLFYPHHAVVSLQIAVRCCTSFKFCARRVLDQLPLLQNQISLRRASGNAASSQAVSRCEGPMRFSRCEPQGTLTAGEQGLELAAVLKDYGRKDP